MRVSVDLGRFRTRTCQCESCIHFCPSPWDCWCLDGLARRALSLRIAAIGLVRRLSIPGQIHVTSVTAMPPVTADVVREQFNASRLAVGWREYRYNDQCTSPTHS